MVIQGWKGTGVLLLSSGDYNEHSWPRKKNAIDSIMGVSRIEGREEKKRRKWFFWKCAQLAGADGGIFVYARSSARLYHHLINLIPSPVWIHATQGVRACTRRYGLPACVGYVHDTTHPRVASGQTQLQDDVGIVSREPEERATWEAIEGGSFTPESHPQPTENSMLPATGGARD